MKRPSQGLIAAIGIPTMMIGIVLYMPPDDDPFSLPNTLAPTSVTVQESPAIEVAAGGPSVPVALPVDVRSAAIVPGAARTRVVVAALDMATTYSTIDRLLAAGYPSAVAATAVQPVSAPAVYFASGFEAEAAGVALALGITTTPLALAPQQITQQITDDDGGGDVIVVLG